MGGGVFLFQEMNTTVTRMDLTFLPLNFQNIFIELEIISKVMSLLFPAKSNNSSSNFVESQAIILFKKHFKLHIYESQAIILI
jgi:hypothetical protein